MKILVKRCRTCGALGVGPRAVKLWPFEGHMYCQEDFQKALAWDESRPEVVRGLRSMRELDVAIAKVPRAYLRKSLPKSKNWRGLIEEWSGLAGFGLERGDRRTFVYYFSRAVWAWDLSEQERA